MQAKIRGHKISLITENIMSYTIFGIFILSEAAFLTYQYNQYKRKISVSFWRTAIRFTEGMLEEKEITL